MRAAMMRAAARAFGLAGGIRLSLSLVLRLAAALRTGRPSALVRALVRALRESGAAACRLGMFAGVFVLVVRALRALREHVASWTGMRLSAQATDCLAGFAAGAASIAWLEGETRTTAQLFIGVRAAQALFNMLVRRKLLTPVPHGDFALFAVSSGLVMYAALMHSDSLPHSYYRFIASTNPIDHAVIRALRCRNTGAPVDRDEFRAFGAAMGIDSLALLDAAAAAGAPMPCALMHPHRGCAHQLGYTLASVARKTLPLYATLNVVQLLVRWRSALRAPRQRLTRCALSTARSTAFMALFNGLYMASVCSHRKLGVRDSQFVYLLAGVICSAAVFVEPKSRRAELASSYVCFCEFVCAGERAGSGGSQLARERLGRLDVRE